MEERDRGVKRKFTEEFKEEAIALGKKLGNSQASRELGINESQIRQWKKKLEGEGKAAQGANKKSYSDLEKEVKRLSKENGYLESVRRFNLKISSFS